MFCSNCGTTLKEGARFCSSCGAATEASCAACGSRIDPGDAFCASCGAPVGTAPASGSSLPTAQPAAERRLVSVLFADLVGFTAHSEGRDPEEVRDLLTHYFDTAREIIGLYGGTVEKFIGDAIMAVWGTPVAREDDTERSVRAALDLIEAIGAIGKESGIELQGRAGIHTGEAAVSIGAQNQGMVAGDMVNTASRLQSVADGGTILVDRATFLGTRDAIAFEEIGELRLKGREDPVDAWRPLRVLGGLGGTRFDDALEPPFTGRDEEFRLIKELLHATGREGKPRLASVIGVAGIGKSRLVWELFKYIDGLSDLVLWHQGRSPAYGDGVAFWALAEMIRMRARIAETDASEEAISKLDACLEEYVRDPEERRWLRPPLLHVLGLGEGGDEQRAQLFAAWRTFFERVAERAPTVLVFEDLHWADPGLVDFIEHLLEWARDSSIYIVTLARPELLDRRPSWGAGQRKFTSIHLEPLPTDDMRLLLKGVVGDLPETMTEQILQRAEGIPLYAVEMIRMLIDHENLIQHNDGYRWSGEVEEVKVPESLHSLIASRLDTLPTGGRLLVQDAAVLGKTFTLDSLAAVSGGDVAEIEARLKDLARREIFTVDIDPRSPERGQYGFVQSLMKEIAYQTLSNADRRDRHMRAAEYFALLGESDLLDVVASHYLDAYRNSAADPELAAMARVRLTEAGERAMSLGSTEQAMLLYDKAFEVADEDSDRGRLRLSAGEAANRAGLLEIALERIEESIDLLKDAGVGQLLTKARFELGQVFFLMSRLDEAAEMLSSALEDFDDPEADPLAAALYSQLSRIHAFRGDFEAASHYAEKAIAPAEKSGQVDIVVQILITRVAICHFLGHVSEADALSIGALKLAEENDLFFELGRAYVNMSANQMLFNPTLVPQTIERGLEVARRYGYSDAEAFLIANAVEAACYLGRWDWARAQIADAAEEVFSREVRSIAVPQLILLEALTGNLDGAHQFLKEYEAAVAASPSLQDQEALAGGTACVALMEDDYDAAFKAVTERLGWNIHGLTTFVMLAHCAAWAGAPEMLHKVVEAFDGFRPRNRWTTALRSSMEAGVAALGGERRRAVELYEKATVDLGEQEAFAARALSQIDYVMTVGAPEAEAAAAEARAFFAEAGNDILVKRIDAAISR